MPFFKCIFKYLLTNLNVRFCFFSKRDSWKPPTYQTKLTSFEKNSHFATIPKWKRLCGWNFFLICFLLKFTKITHKLQTFRSLGVILWIIVKSKLRENFTHTNIYTCTVKLKPTKSEYADFKFKCPCTYINL